MLSDKPLFRELRIPLGYRKYVYRTDGIVISGVDIYAILFCRVVVEG
jgi:hypothetical protein